ncbi:hypothetical protein [uncultured Marinobacter sp.]|uniref:hypothetical protein n=1 Tax=uncultured Marinobacter sp. TaxID=187379 RepID=UPI00258D1AC4|nr:hypothetical protein [uncultured Marinobacter sp.]
MINTSKEIVFLVSGDELSKQCFGAIEDVCWALRQNFGVERTSDLIRVADGNITFLRFFDPIYEAEIGRISEEGVLKLFKLTTYPDAKRPPDSEIQELTLYERGGNRPAPTRGYFRGIKLGLQLFFMNLWRRKAILLPYEFNLPQTHWMMKEDYRELFLSPVSAYVRSFNHKFGGNESSFFREKKKDKALRMLSAYWVKMTLGTTWYEPEDISLDEARTIAKENNASKSKKTGSGYTTSALSMTSLVRTLLERFGDRIPFSASDYASATQDDFKRAMWDRYATGDLEYDVLRQAPKALSPSEKLRFGLGEIFDSIEALGEEELFAKMNDLTIKNLSSDYFIDVYLEVSPAEYHEPATVWFGLVETWLKHKRYSRNDQFAGAVGFLFLYMFVYLPWWYRKNRSASKLPQYPSNPNLMNGAIFMASLIRESFELPLDYVSFMEKVSDKRRWANTTHYSVMQPIVSFFRWLHGKKHRLPDAERFELPIDHDDLPQIGGRTQSSKNPMQRRLFKLFIAYCYAMNDLQEQLMEIVERGDLDPTLLGGVGTYIKFSQTECNRGIEEQADQPNKVLDLSRYNVKCPTVRVGDEEYSVSGFYRFFFHKKFRVSDTEEKLLIFPGDLRVCQLMLETGIRAQHLRWLDVDTFDMKVNYHVNDEYLHPLLVNTDKIKKQPWISVVSSTVIKICAEQRLWRKKVLNPMFHERVYYNGNKNSVHGTIKPLFAYNPKSGKPSQNYENTWTALQFGFQEFLRENHISSEPLVKVKPVGHAFHQSVSSESVTVDDNDGKPFCPVTYAKRSTPHSARNSVVNEKVRYLPHHIVGEFITGQHERLVYYYNLRDSEDHYADQAMQWVDRDQGPRFPQDNEELDQIMTPADAVGSTMAEGIKENPKQAIEAYGLISIKLITDKDGNIEDGVDLLRAQKSLALAVNPTHFCPFDNKCPQEIVEELGDFQPCAICPYAISGINHLPAISAAKDAMYEQFIEEKENLSTMRNKRPEALDTIAELENRCSQLAIYAAGWEYREKEIFSKVEGIKKGFDDGLYTVGKPEFISNLLERRSTKTSDIASYIVKRLRDCTAFPLTETKTINAKFEMTRRKMLAAKDPSTLFDFAPCPKPVAELYSLIHSFKELHNINDETIRMIINSSPHEILQLNQSSGLEGHTDE